MAYALEIKDVHKTFNPGTINEKVALDGVNLLLNEGDFVTIIGGNGAGKSTTLNAVAGVWPIDSGSIIIGGNDVTGLPEHKRKSVPGSDDRNSSDHVHRRKYGDRGKKRKTEKPEMGRHQGRA